MAAAKVANLAQFDTYLAMFAEINQLPPIQPIVRSKSEPLNNIQADEKQINDLSSQVFK